MPTQTHDWIKTTANRPLLIVYARLATTANVNLTTDVDAGSTIDGVTVAEGDVLLIKDHATGATKGLYVAPAAAGTATRHHLMPVGAEVHGVCVRVLEGTTNGNRTFWCQAAEGAATVGTDALTFATDDDGGISDGDTLSTGLTFPNTGLHILDTNASHDLIVAPGSNLTADRTLTLTTGDADRTLDISAASVTVSSFAATILDDADAAAVRTTIGAGTGSGDALVANPLSQFAATTSAQLRGVLSDETGTGAAVFADSPTLVTPALGTPSSGTLTNCTGLPTAGLVDAAVTYAKMQDVSAASKLLGRGDSGSGDVQEITLGTNLSMSGTTLNASGGGGNSFETIAVAGQSNVVADSATDTLTLVAGTNITITTNAGTDTITIAASGGGSETCHPFLLMGG